MKLIKQLTNNKFPTISEGIMKKIIMFSLLSVLTITLFLGQAVNAQPTIIPLTVTDGVNTTVLEFGIHPSATAGLDSLLFPNERELPPIPPPNEGIFDARFTGVPLMAGSLSDIRTKLTGDQIDVWNVTFQTGVLNGPVTLSWPANLSTGSGFLKIMTHESISEPYPERLFVANMLTQTSILIPGPYSNEPFVLKIIRTTNAAGINVNPTSHNFGTVVIGLTAQQVFTVTNTGTRNLEIDEIKTSNPLFAISSVGPEVVAPSATFELTVSFSPVASGSYTGNITLAHNAGNYSTVIPVQAEAGAGTKFRTFTANELVTLTGGKLQKPVKRKADKVEFSVDFIVPAGGPFNKLHVEWGSPILKKEPTNQFEHIVKLNDVVITNYTLAPAIDNAAKKFDYTFAADLAAGDKVTIHAWAAKGKAQKGKYWWLPAAKPAKLVMGVAPGSAFTLNEPRLPMPNYGNVAAEIFPTAGIAIGTGKLKMPTFKDMLKTLDEKGANHDGAPGALILFGGKPWVKEAKAAPKSKHNNVLMANLIAFKFNLASSSQGNTPGGLGSLLYHNPGNEFHGLPLTEIAIIADPKMTVLDPAFDYANLNTVLALINGAFSGAIDTANPGFGAKLILKGVKPLAEVPFLRPGTLVAATTPAPSIVEIPDNFVMHQNYPNPFNPTTTIEFSLPEDAIVTLKVYNMLGQEVATLINREELSYGPEYVSFDASSLSSGVYIYRLTAEGLETGAKTSIMKKMVLMK